MTAATATAAADPTGPAAAARAPRRLHLRRAVLVLHLATAVGWLGVSAVFLVLTVWLTGVRDPATLRAGYAVHELGVTWLARPAAIGAAATGTALLLLARSRRGRWWVWWVPAKAVLVVATVLLTAPTSPELLRFVIDGAALAGTPEYQGAQHRLVLLAVLHVVVITVAIALSVTRPGRRLRGPPPDGSATSRWQFRRRH